MRHQVQLEFKDKQQNYIRLQLDKDWKLAGSLSDNTTMSLHFSTGLIWFTSFIFLKCLNMFRAGKAEARPSLGLGGSFQVIFDWTTNMPVVERETARDRGSQVWKHTTASFSSLHQLHFFRTSAVCGAEVGKVTAVGFSTTDSTSFICLSDR